MKPLKEDELRALARCGSCNRLLGQCGPLPLFYVVTVEHHWLDGAAVKRQAGLEAMVGSPAIARAMGPNEDMTLPLSSSKVMICERCGTHTTIASISALQGA